MAYVKNTWATGDVISAEKLNNIENGVESAEQGGSNLFAITVSGDGAFDHTLNKTWQEIYDAFLAGKTCIITGDDEDSIFSNNSYLVCKVYNGGENNYVVMIAESSGSAIEFYADQTSSYPTYINN